MSFRATLFWVLLLTLAAMAVVERGFRSAAEAVAHRAEARIARRLDYAVLDLEELLNEAARGGPALQEPAHVEREPDAVYTTLPPVPGRIGSLPQVDRGPGWFSRTIRLPDGAIVSVSVPLSWWERIARDSARVEWMAIPLLATIVLMTASLLTRRLTRPLRELMLATEQMVEVGFASPLPIPPGDDEVSGIAESFERTRVAIRGLVDRERTFTRFVSHELRTPLSALKLQLERARLPGVDSEDVMPRLDRNVRRMEEVLSALLQLARASQPHEPGEDDDRQLGDVVEEVLAGLDPEARARVAVSNATPVGAWVRDARLLQQALANLLDNAIRHGAHRAALRLWVDEDRLEVRIVDDGPGVSERELHRVTEPFFRGASSAWGLGLGLALVTTIADALHGELILRNRDGGFEAALRLPGIVRIPRTDD